MTDFSTIDGKCIIDYKWSFFNQSGTHGIQISRSVPGTTGYDCALSRIKSTMFYIKTW